MGKANYCFILGQSTFQHNWFNWKKKCIKLNLHLQQVIKNLLQKSSFLLQQLW